MTRNAFILLAILVLTGACGKAQSPALAEAPALAKPSGEATQWPVYGGKDAQQYADVSEITSANVKKLVKAWEYNHGDVSDGKAPYRSTSALQVTPLLMEETLYLCTPFNRVIALDPETGEEKWAYDPEVDVTGNFSNQLVCRGVAWWQDKDAEEGLCTSRILTATNDSRLIALDARTGGLCEDFGSGGTVDMTKGVGEVRWYGEYHHTSPPLVIGDLAIVGSAIGDNSRINPPSGVIRAYDVRTGDEVWAWDLAPPGYEAAPEQLTPEGHVLGTPNVWAPMIGDEARDLVFVPTGNPSPDYFRPGEVPLDYYGSALVALKGSTGEVVWHYQFVHNDHWDFDTPAQPTLMEIEQDGQSIPAVVQATKMGFLFALNRETGESLFPVEERPVHQTHFEGDVTSPTQPFPLLPPPLVPTHLTEEDAWGLTPWDKGKCKKIIRELRFHGMYTIANEEWTLMYPGNAGGSNWGGIAADPERQVVIANVMDMAWMVRLIENEEFTDYRTSHSGEIAPQMGTPYGIHRKMLLSPFGLPCTRPPWGKLVAVDMKEGQILWEVPFGTVRDLAPVPLPWKLGVPNIGGPLVTSGGLIFIGAAMDNYIRAYDIRDGKELWKARLPAGGQATPMSYAVTNAEGRTRQFVLIAAGGHGRAGTTLGDSIIAYALPE